MTAGYKDFSTGAVLTESDIDDNLANGPFIHLTRSSDQTISNNSTTDMSWTVETSDRSALVAVTLTSITIPSAMAGVCLISAFARFATNSTGIRILAIQVDGVTLVEDRAPAMSAAPCWRNSPWRRRATAASVPR